MEIATHYLSLINRLTGKNLFYVEKDKDDIVARGPFDSHSFISLYLGSSRIFDDIKRESNIKFLKSKENHKKGEIFINRLVNLVLKKYSDPRRYEKY